MAKSFRCRRTFFFRSAVLPQMRVLVVDQILRLFPDQQADDKQDEDEHTDTGVESGGLQFGGKINGHEDGGEKDLHDQKGKDEKSQGRVDGSKQRSTGRGSGGVSSHG